MFYYSDNLTSTSTANCSAYVFFVIFMLTVYKSIEYMDIDWIAIYIQSAVSQNADTICVASTLTQLFIQLVISYVLLTKEDPKMKIANTATANMTIMTTSNE